MKTTKIYLTLLVAFTVMTFTSCSDDTATTPKTEEPEEQVEGEYVGTWKSTGDQLPTQEMQDKFESLVLTLKGDDSYTYTFTNKNGKKTIYAGNIAVTKTDDKHTSGSHFWWMNIYVETINGQQFSGGWEGIFTYENPTTLKLNVEPSVVGWSKWPASDEGLGSGQSGMESVITFTKQ